MKLELYPVCLLATFFLFSGCDGVITINPDDERIDVPDVGDKDDDGQKDEEGKKDDDGQKEDGIITLNWKGNDVDIVNNSNLKISKDGAHVTIGTPESAGQKVEITLTGSTDNGSLKIYNGLKANDTNKKILLIFKGVSLKSAKGPAINIQSGKTVSVLLEDGTENKLTDAATYTGLVEGEDAKACFFSEKQLEFSGKGKLTIEGMCKHAICVDDYMQITDGHIVIASSRSDGVHVNDYLQVDGGILDIHSVGECIQTEEGGFQMSAGELILVPSGEKSGGIETVGDILIEGGALSINAGGAAAKCLKSDNDITISGGTLDLRTTGAGVYDSSARDTSASACISAENSVFFKGGDITCNSTGNGGKGVKCYRFYSYDGATANIGTTGGVYSYSTAKSRPKAVKAAKNIIIEGGNLNITTTGSEAEGLESKDSLFVNGGLISITARDDGMNAAGVITFNGGYSFIYATGNDAIDTNRGKAGSIVVNGGVVIAHSAASPEEAFDADNHAYLTFNGGYILATGGQQGGGGGGGRPGFGGGGTSGSNPTCGQPTASWNTSATKGYFILSDSAGNVVMSCYVPRNLSSCYVMFSAPINAGKTYKCGFSTSVPTGSTSGFGTYFYTGGTAGSLSKSFTAPTTYGTI